MYTAELSLRAVTCNTCYGWAHLMLRVIKVESKRWYYKFCEMLRVNLDLLQLLQNLMTALHSNNLSNGLVSFHQWNIPQLPRVRSLLLVTDLVLQKVRLFQSVFRQRQWTRKQKSVATFLILRVPSKIKFCSETIEYSLLPLWDKN